MSSSYEERVMAVHWAGLESAYGSAKDVGRWLIELKSTDWETAFQASHLLWCSLCHQHVFISPAAEAAIPFLFETAKKRISACSLNCWTSSVALPFAQNTRTQIRQRDG